MFPQSVLTPGRPDARHQTGWPLYFRFKNLWYGWPGLYPATSRTWMQAPFHKSNEVVIVRFRTLEPRKLPISLNPLVFPNTLQKTKSFSDTYLTGAVILRLFSHTFLVLSSLPWLYETDQFLLTSYKQTLSFPWCIAAFLVMLLLHFSGNQKKKSLNSIVGANFFYLDGRRNTHFNSSYKEENILQKLLIN